MLQTATLRYEKKAGGREKNGSHANPELAMAERGRRGVGRLGLAGRQRGGHLCRARAAGARRTAHAGRPGAARACAARRGRHHPHQRLHAAGPVARAGPCACAGARLAAGVQPPPDARHAVRGPRAGHAGYRQAHACAGHTRRGAAPVRIPARQRARGAAGLQRGHRGLLCGPAHAPASAGARIHAAGHHAGRRRQLGLGARGQRGLGADDGAGPGRQLGQRVRAAGRALATGHTAAVAADAALSGRGAGHRHRSGRALPGAGRVPPGGTGGVCAQGGCRRRGERCLGPLVPRHGARCGHQRRQGQQQLGALGQPHGQRQAPAGQRSPSGPERARHLVLRASAVARRPCAGRHAAGAH